MKVLVLPVNVASIGSITVEALNRIQGISAKGFFINRHKYHYPSKNSFYFSGVSRLRRPLSWIYQKAQRTYLFRKLYLEADIIHWLYDDTGLTRSELHFVKKNPKPSVVEWVGSDIRNPDFLSSINPFYAEAFRNGYEYAGYESAERSSLNQRKFKALGSTPLVTPEMDLYIDDNLFNERHFIEHKLFLEEFIPAYPHLETKKPLVVHSPTAKKAKGSDYIIAVVEELKKEIDFDFKLLHDMSRTDVMGYVKNCDVFIDQVIIGMYGLATAEAMAYGKPAFCYLLDEVKRNGLPDNCPIVNVSVLDLKEKLKKFLSDPMLRHKTGIESRKYAELHFDAHKNAEKLAEIYGHLLNE